MYTKGCRRIDFGRKSRSNTLEPFLKKYKMLFLLLDSYSYLSLLANLFLDAVAGIDKQHEIDKLVDGGAEVVQCRKKGPLSVSDADGQI